MNFDQIFYFKKIPPRYFNSSQRMLREIYGKNGLDLNRGLVMFLSKTNFGVFTNLELNGFDEETGEIFFDSKDILYDFKKGYTQAFRKFEDELLGYSVNILGSYRKNMRNSRIPYLITDIEDVKKYFL